MQAGLAAAASGECSRPTELQCALHDGLPRAHRYVCCNGNCPCSGRCGEQSNPECCLVLEVRGRHMTGGSWASAQPPALPCCTINGIEQLGTFPLRATASYYIHTIAQTKHIQRLQDKGSWLPYVTAPSMPCSPQVCCCFAQSVASTRWMIQVQPCCTRAPLRIYMHAANQHALPGISCRNDHVMGNHSVFVGH